MNSIETSNDRRLFLNNVNPSSDIDLSSVPESVWELLVETAFDNPNSKHSRSSMAIVNVPFNLTLLHLGPRLSSRLTEPFHLPATLVSYKGPIMSGMRLGLNMKNLHLFETKMSLQTSDVVLPPYLQNLTVENPLEFSNLDSTKLPSQLESFQIVGKFNCSLERMSFPPHLKVVDLGMSTQKVDLLATRADILTTIQTEDSPTTHSGVVTVDLSTDSTTTPTDSTTTVLDSLRQHLPRLDKLQVFLDEDSLTSLGDVWTEVLFEGRVKVRELTVFNRNPQKSCLGNCGEVFNRSSILRRKLCRKLIVNDEKYSHASHLNLALALKKVSGISLEISYIGGKGPSTCLLPRLASLLKLKASGTPSKPKYVSDSFGATSTSAEISAEQILKIFVGDSPNRYEPPTKPQPLIVPVSSSALQEVSNVEASKPRDKPIILYTWKSCGFCQKQTAVIEEFKQMSESKKNLFHDKVEVKSFENPHDVPDKRVDSFPTWVKDDTLIVGVQNSERLTSLLAE